MIKRIHRGHPDKEAMLGVSRYLWCPHMHKDIVNLTEECRSCTRYDKKAKYLIAEKDSKSLSLLTQPGQVFNIGYAGAMENHKGKNIFNSSNRTVKKNKIINRN